MSDDTEISKRILELVEESSPETVESLIEQAHTRLEVPKDVLLKHIIELQNQGKLTLTIPHESIPASLDTYLISSHAIWFWAIIILSTATTISIYDIGEDDPIHLPPVYPGIDLRPLPPGLQPD